MAEEDANHQHEHLCSLSSQGGMARCWAGKSPQLWVRAVQNLPPEPVKFALNAALDTLPTNSNLHQWGKKSYDTCPLCSSHQSLLHILNNCPIAMDLHRYSRRHDEVLLLVGNFVRSHLHPSFLFTIDLASMGYSFPQHITPTDMRPDIVLWSDEKRELGMLELMISYESLVADSHQRKQAKYQDLVQAVQAAGYSTQLLTLEVCSRGMLDVEDLEKIRSSIGTTKRETTELCLSIIWVTLLESFHIWGSRNTVH